MDKIELAERLEAHAAIHEGLVPYDDEQKQWADDLRQAAAALRESEWRPIESAPNPGIFLVLLERPMIGSFVHCANWSPNVKTIGTAFSFDAPKPTHWMPIPPPPEESK